MKTIPLTQGKFAIVDDCDFEYLSKFKWYAAHHKGGRWYAVRRARVNRIQRGIFMHREITGFPAGRPVDHADRNGLNNTRDNLRVCTESQNHANRKRPSHNTSGVKGVSLCKITNRWRVMCMKEGKNHRLGYFDNLSDAKTAYEKLSRKLHGEFARTE